VVSRRYIFSFDLRKSSEVRANLKEKPKCGPGQYGVNRVELRCQITNCLEFLDPCNDFIRNIIKDDFPPLQFKLPLLLLANVTVRDGLLDNIVG